MTIYTSAYEDVSIPSTDIYSLLFSPSRRQTSDSSVLLIDAQTKRRYTHGQIRERTLALGEGLAQFWKERKPQPLIASRPVEGVRYSAEEQKTSVLLFSPNTPSYVLGLLSCLASSAGIIATLANSAYQPSELEHQLRDARAAIVFVHPDLLPVVEECLGKCGSKDWRSRVFLLDEESGKKGSYENYNVFAKRASKDKHSRKHWWKGKRPAPDDVAFLCYSSGTTGLSKGVATTHRNVCTVTIITKWAVLNPQVDTMMHVLPIFHIFGLSNVFTAIYYGLPAVVLKKFDPVVWSKAVQDFKITFTLLVPPILVLLATGPYVKDYDLSSLKTVICGAAPLGSELINRVHGVLPNLKIMQGYGLTETSPIVTITPVDELPGKLGSIGTVLSNIETRLVDDDGKDATKGERGELWVRGTSVMKGYWRNPKATADSITSEGWFQTGDVAIVDDDGYFFIVDRKKELIKYKGFQVPPADLENTLLSHPKVADVGVIGVWSEEQATELPRAYIVPVGDFKEFAPGSVKAKALSQEIQDWMAAKVSNHKRLRGGVVLIEIIPKSAAGKILRRQLRDLAADSALKPKAKL